MIRRLARENRIPCILVVLSLFAARGSFSDGQLSYDGEVEREA